MCNEGERARKRERERKKGARKTSERGREGRKGRERDVAWGGRAFDLTRNIILGHKISKSLNNECQ